MNRISFSLYGKTPKYCMGMVANADLAEKIYPGWQVIVYHDETVPRKVLNQLTRRKCRLINADKTISKNGMFWRFLVHDLPGTARYICRDCDSRLSERESKAVHDWIENGKDIHSIRDHPHHIWPLSGGLFGVNRSKVKFSMEDAIKHWKHNNDYCEDNKFLASLLWGNYSCEESDLMNGTFTAYYDDWRFVGKCLIVVITQEGLIGRKE